MGRDKTVVRSSVIDFLFDSLKGDYGMRLNTMSIDEQTAIIQETLDNLNGAVKFIRKYKISKR